MFERASPPKEPPVPLSLAAGQRIVMAGLDPVLGWIGNESARTAQALVFPQWLLEPRASETVAYACNLPAPAPRAQPEHSLPPMPHAAAFEAETPLPAASLPGGQVAIVSTGGRRGAIQLRWACVTASASIGAVWRCFLKLSAPSAASPWTPVGHDYVFEAASGFLVNEPGSLNVRLGGSWFKLTHPGGKLTCFPSHSGRVKVTRISADGWAKRELLSLWLYPDRSIIAQFSDGAETRIATAAPARSAAILAA